MKKVFLFIMLVCANVLVWGQTEKGKAALSKANAGDAKAQFEVAEYYEFGEEGFAKDVKQAVEWYTKSADQNNSVAFGKLEYIYKTGKPGVAKDDKKYIHYLKKAAESGRPESMIDLAVYYRDGKYGLEKDEDEFLRWAKKAADSRLTRAMYELGVYYKSKNNKDEAVLWYKKCIDRYYRLYSKNHEDAARDLKQLGVNYNPANKSEDVKTDNAKKNEDDESAVKDGKVILYERNGAVLQSAKLMEKNGATHVKVDNGLYPLKPCNLKINGVSYNYSVYLFDRDYYVKGNIPGFKSGSSSAQRSNSATTKRSSSAKSEKTSSAPAKKETKDDKTIETFVKKEVGKGLKKILKK